MLVKKENAGGTIASASHGEFTPNKEGIYDVPDVLGEELVRVLGFVRHIEESVKAEVKKVTTPRAKAAPKAKAIVAEKVPADTVVTPENAGAVKTADGVTHVGVIPAK